MMGSFMLLSQSHVRTRFMHSGHRTSSKRNIRKVTGAPPIVSRTVRNTVTPKARTGLEIWQAPDVRCTVEMLKENWMLYKRESTSHIEESDKEKMVSIDLDQNNEHHNEDGDQGFSEGLESMGGCWRKEQPASVPSFQQASGYIFMIFWRPLSGEVTTDFRPARSTRGGAMVISSYKNHLTRAEIGVRGGSPKYKRSKRVLIFSFAPTKVIIFLDALHGNDMSLYVFTRR